MTSTTTAPVAPPLPHRASVRARSRRKVRILIPVAAAGLAGLALSRVSALGASWSDALTRLVSLDWRWPLVFGVVWLLGLAAHTVMLTAALPGLTHLRALTLNVAGNAVANLLPLGGVVGTALNLSMARSWGHPDRDFVRFALVSKAWDFIAKLTMPLLSVGVLLALGRLEPTGRGWALLAGSVLSAAAGTLVVALLGHAGPLLRTVAQVERVLRRRAAENRRGFQQTAAVSALFDGTQTLVRCRWRSLTGGMAGYLALQCLLLWLCLTAVGLRLPAATLFAALVAGRLLSLLSITPAGVGFVEAGTTAVLVALHVDPTGALAGLLLYRAFVVFAEVPAGGLAIALWAVNKALPQRRKGRSGPPSPSRSGVEHVKGETVCAVQFACVAEELESGVAGA